MPRETSFVFSFLNGMSPCSLLLLLAMIASSSDKQSNKTQD